MRRPCGLCGAEQFSVWDTHNGFEVVICGQCGMGRSEMPDEGAEEVDERYDESYYRSMWYDRKWRFRIRRATRWLRYIQELRQPPGVLLDIGCAMGYYLDAAQRLGWTAYGTDVSRHALKETQRRGYQAFWSMHPRDFPEWLPPLDVVTAAQVIEHVPDPVEYLQALRAKMSPGGVIYLQLPNFQKLLRHGPQPDYAGPPEHLQFFTLDTMRRTLDKAGWRLVKVPLLRRRYVGCNPVRWLGEVLLECPRELTREGMTLNGKLTNMHVFAVAGETGE